MSFLLLGVDSLIACFAIAPVVSKRSRVPLALCFGLGDGVGYLIGSAFHWSMPDTVATVVETSVMVALGVYWIVLAFASRRVAGTKWIWMLPWALSIDNITFGLIDGHWGTSVGVQAFEQALSSAIQAGIGLALGYAVVRSIPALQRSRLAMTGFAGCALIVAAGLELIVG